MRKSELLSANYSIKALQLKSSYLSFQISIEMSTKLKLKNRDDPSLVSCLASSRLGNSIQDETTSWTTSNINKGNGKIWTLHFDPKSRLYSIKDVLLPINIREIIIILKYVSLNIVADIYFLYIYWIQYIFCCIVQLGSHNYISTREELFIYNIYSNAVF